MSTASFTHSNTSRINNRTSSSLRGHRRHRGSQGLSGKEISRSNQAPIAGNRTGFYCRLNCSYHRNGWGKWSRCLRPFCPLVKANQLQLRSALSSEFFNFFYAKGMVYFTLFPSGGIRCRYSIVNNRFLSYIYTGARIERGRARAVLAQHGGTKAITGISRLSCLLY